MRLQLSGFLSLRTCVDLFSLCSLFLLSRTLSLSIRKRRCHSPLGTVYLSSLPFSICCATDFCGFCMRACRDSVSAHRHVAKCRKNTANPGGMHARIEEFHRLRNIEKKQRLEEYWATVPEDIQYRVYQKMIEMQIPREVLPYIEE